MRKCLIIGGNGFVGSHLVNALSESGYDTFSFDRYSNSRVNHNDSLNIHKIKGDVFDLPQLENHIQKVDYVFHCLSVTTPASSDDDPYTDIEKNLLNNVKIFDMCTKSNLEKVIFISSGGVVYGGEGQGVEDEVIHPVSPYGIAKFASERYLEYFKRKSGMEYIVYRLSNPYGPGQITKHNQGVIPRFIDHISHGIPITIYGDGTSTRDYVYVEDVADMIVKSFSRENIFNVYNIGSGRQTSLREVVATLTDILNKSTELVYMQPPDTYVHSAPLDTARFRSEFLIQPKMSLRSGLEATLASRSTR